MSELKSYGEWCDAIPAENEVAAGILRSWRESAYKLLTDNYKLEQENARLREELQKLKRKEKPIRFDSLADWRRE